jgi:hypothetical protein
MKAIYLGLVSVLLLATAPLSAQTNQPIQELKANAEKGNAEAQLRLGLRYYGGLGVTNDNAEAVKWIRKAAEQSYPDAEYFLGFFYESGIGMAEDQKWRAF